MCSSDCLGKATLFNCGISWALNILILLDGVKPLYVRFHFSDNTVHNLFRHRKQGLAGRHSFDVCNGSSAHCCSYSEITFLRTKLNERLVYDLTYMIKNYSRQIIKKPLYDFFFRTNLCIVFQSSEVV